MIKSVTMRTAAVVLSLCCLVGLSSCGQEEMPGRLDGMYSSDSSAEDTAETNPAQTDSEKYPAPKFKSGDYTMTSTSEYEQYIYSGSNIMSLIKTSQTYTYDINLKVEENGSMTAIYTFSRIQTSYEGSDTVTMDTNDLSGGTGEDKPYYDLIGQSFTLNISKDYRLSVSGIDKITSQYPDTANIISDENMLEISSDLFYNMGDSFGLGSSWQINQSGIINTYKVSKVNDDRFVIDIIGGELTVPDEFTSGEFTYHYTDCNSLSGSLLMNCNDRMIQEQSSYQDNKGTLEYSGTTYKFTESASSVCNISKK